MTGITIEHVTKTFGDAVAVDDASVEIAAGELFFLLGPSGCGKTTLLRMIAGFYLPERGRILFGDKDMTAVPPHKRNTGMVFQSYALWPHMTVRQNLEFGLEMHNVPAKSRAERVDRALEMVQMTEYGGRSPNQLSGGQQQRVAVSRALVLEPDVVLLDEPLANLDAKLRLDMREQIKRIHEQLGLTMVYVTHDQEEALSMADRIAVMVRGGIAQIGGPRDVYSRPASPFVADFIGEANILHGKVVATGDRISVKTAIGVVRAAVFNRDAAVGDAVVCAIRPERLDVLGAGELRGNVFEGTVVSVVYLGNHERVFVKASDGSELKAIEYRTDRPKAQRGQTTRLGCEAEDVVVLKDEEPARC